MLELDNGRTIACLVYLAMAIVFRILDEDAQGEISMPKTTNSSSSGNRAGGATALALLLFLIQVGLSMFGIQNFLLGVGAFTGIAALLVYAAWMWLRDRGNGLVTRLLVSASIIGVMIVLIWRPAETHYSGEYGPKSPVNSVDKRPKIVTEIDSDIVARFWARGIAPQPPLTETVMVPKFKELFYEWKMTFEPTGIVQDVVVRIRDDQLDKADRIKVQPLSGTVSGPSPEWLSGFVEPSMAPDFYVRTITFARLEAGQLATITIRRPITFSKSPKIFKPLQFSRSAELNVANCDVTESKYSSAADLARIAKHLEFLANWKNGDKPIPIKLDPDAPEAPLGPNEIESTIEGRCQERDECKHLLMQRMEARRDVQ